jgi:hypothetical protein
VTSRFRIVFESELDSNGIIWCQGDRRRAPGDGQWCLEPCDAQRSRGGRHPASGGAWAIESANGPTIHLGREVTTRYGLQIALHEVGHIVLGHTGRTPSGRRKSRQRVYEREAAAESWSFRRMEELGIEVPLKSRERAARYVAYRKQRGDRVIAARARSQKRRKR